MGKLDHLDGTMTDLATRVANLEGTPPGMMVGEEHETLQVPRGTLPPMTPPPLPHQRDLVDLDNMRSVKVEADGRLDPQAYIDWEIGTGAKYCV